MANKKKATKAEDVEYDATGGEVDEPVEANETIDSEEKVVLTKTQFDAIQQDIDVLKKSVNRGRLEEQEAKVQKGKKVLPKGHLKRLKGKLIVKWLGVNEVGSKAEHEILYQGTTPVGEVLKGHYIDIDGDPIVTESVQFYRSTDLEYFTKIGQEGDEWIIKFDNPELPQEYKIKELFINP